MSDIARDPGPLTTMRRSAAFILAAAAIGVAFAAACTGAPQGGGRAPLQKVRIVRSYPHDPRAFTQGLLYDGGFLYESTGSEDRSSRRKVDLQTGSVLRLPG